MKRATLLGALLAVACGGAAVPQEQLTAAEASVRAAEVAGAQENPQAALQLKKANEQIQHAKALIADKEHERAAMVLRRAEVDANLAIAMAKEGALRAEAERARAELEELKRKSGGAETQVAAESK